MGARNVGLLVSGSILLSLVGSPAYSLDASLSGSNSAAYTEGSSGVAPFSSVSLGGGPFDGSYVDFEVVDSAGLSITGGADTDEFDDLTLASSDSVAVGNGVLSISDGTLYVGKGSTAEALGEIDATYDGQDGTKLRVNFSTTFENSGFESGSVSPWTVVNSQINMGTTQILGYTTPADSTLNYPANCSSQGLNDNDTPVNGGSYNYQVQTSEKNSGTYSLRLYSTMTTANGGDVVHGPAAYSVEFDGSQGQTLS